MKAMDKRWAGPLNLLQYHILSNVLRSALKNDVITEEDLFRDDAHVMAKVRAADVGEVTSELAKLARSIPFELSSDGIPLKAKFRYVDPQFLVDGQLYKLSDADPTYKADLQRQREVIKRGIHVTLL